MLLPFDSIYDTVPNVVRAIRSGVGPALIEASVVRLDPHSSSDDHRKYRDESDLQAVSRRDPILRTERTLVANDVPSENDICAMRAEVKAAVDPAADEADEHPAPTTMGLLPNIHAKDDVVLGSTQVPTYLSTEPVALIDAIRHGLREELTRNSKVVLSGEDIGPQGRRVRRDSLTEHRDGDRRIQAGYRNTVR